MTDNKGWRLVTQPHKCKLPGSGTYFPQGTVIECTDEECRQQWKKSLFAFLSDGWVRVQDEVEPIPADRHPLPTNVRIVGMDGKEIKD